jgi:hypothetical protein
MPPITDAPELTLPAAETNGVIGCARVVGATLDDLPKIWRPDRRAGVKAFERKS